MTTVRAVSVEPLREVLDSMRAAREQLKATDAAYRRAIKNLERGLSVADTLQAMAADSVRIDLNHVLQLLERRRHAARLALIGAGLHEGLTIGELGRKMGFSRQLAARYAKEARGGVPA